MMPPCCVAEIHCTLTLSSESEDRVYHTYMAEGNRITLFLFSTKLNYYLAINASRISLRLAFQKEMRKLRLRSPWNCFFLSFFLSLRNRRQHMAIIHDMERNINERRCTSLLLFISTGAINIVHITLKE